MTPEAFGAWFDAQLVFIIFVWGLMVKYVPVIAKIPNSVIGWGGVLIACLAKLAVPEAHAQGAVEGIAKIPWWISAPLQVFWASNGYERFIRPILERLGIYKAHEKTTKDGGWTWAPQVVGVPDATTKRVEAAKVEAAKHA